MKNEQKSWNVYDWIVTKNGEVRQITDDDMMDLKGEDIERLANEDEIPMAIMQKVRRIADRQAGLVSERETLDNYTPLPLTNMTTPRYSEYTVLKAMKKHSEKQTSKLKQQRDELWEALKHVLPNMEAYGTAYHKDDGRWFKRIFSKEIELIQKLSNENT